ncbi:MAG: hypothetical protein ACYTX0_48865 [Nostoc sp.]
MPHAQYFSTRPAPTASLRDAARTLLLYERLRQRRPLSTSQYKCPMP